MIVRTLRAACAALTLILATSAALPAAAATSAHRQTVVFSGGCFWGVEAVFDSVKGVQSAVSGYSGGAKATAHYEIVSTGLTGHAESVEVTYDPTVVSFDKLLDVFFNVAHDPTEKDYQGPDHGSQYRSAIFYTTPDQKRAAQAEIERLTASKAYSGPIVTQVVPLGAFYAAEAYHQHFLQKNPDYPYIVVNDLPKLKVLAAKYPALLKPHSLARG
ncbi:MAG: peptide-methionine (S)-S-oxide reductase MsrA [Candidatus Velthaea sp.]